jgi:hypothetical protein
MGSIPIGRFILGQRQATQGYEIGVKTLIRWEGPGNRRRGGGGFMALTYPRFAPRFTRTVTRSSSQE